LIYTCPLYKNNTGTNEIIVLQKREDCRRGNHDELLAQGGFYRKLVEMQEVL
jgi:ABC-type multidrug transport system fused ATPase/permease subunit